MNALVAKNSGRTWLQRNENIRGMDMKCEGWQLPSEGLGDWGGSYQSLECPVISFFFLF